MNKREAIALLEECGCSPNVIEHCKLVSDYAFEIATNIQENSIRKGQPIRIDIESVVIGGLLHDIGRSRTHGIDHAVTGARIAVEKGLDDKLVKIIERHIGAGIPKTEAPELGLPEKDYLPATIEEKIVAYADNLIFDNEKGSIDELILDLRKKNLDEKVIQRFIKLNSEISSMLV